MAIRQDEGAVLLAFRFEQTRFQRSQRIESSRQFDVPSSQASELVQNSRQQHRRLAEVEHNQLWFQSSHLQLYWKDRHVWRC